ncbi:MAG: DMP19 family protein [Bacteroidaceae bacterium]|nr:DMP19 family protein [Bacteroidaceae bacterium]
MTYEESIEYINKESEKLIERIDGVLTEQNMDLLSLDEHILLAYKYLRDEVMEGGFIQLIQNGYGPYVLLGPLPMLMKKQLGLKKFGQFLFDVKREYVLHKDELEADKTEEEFMAQYEQFEALNEYGDEYLDDYEEIVTPAVAEYFTNIDNK